MPTKIVPDDVWAQLDPLAGRLSRRQRHHARLIGAGLAVALLTGVLGYLSGAGYPRIDGDMRAAHGTPSTHLLYLQVELDNRGWVAQHVSGMTVDDSRFSVVSTRPATLVLPPGASHLVTVRIVVRGCSSISRNDLLPVAVVVRHWWGHESRVLFSSRGDSGYVGVAGLACPGG